MEEAKHFGGQMQFYVEDPPKFAFSLSAFLSAARSVTFIMQSEFNNLQGFDIWYEDKQKEMSSDKDFKFFNNLRVVTIHQKPVIPHRKTEISIFETIAVSESVTIKVIDKEGNVVSEQTSKPKKPKSQQETEITVKDSWYFEERPNDDLLNLCNEYVQKIEKLVEECERQFHIGCSQQYPLQHTNIAGHLGDN